MMKLLILITVCVVIANCKVVNKTVIQLKPELATQIKALADTCKREGDDVEGYFQIIKDGKYSDTDSFGHFVYCLISKAGFSNDEGNFYVDKVAELFPEKDIATKLFTDCNKISGKNSEETSFLGFKCFVDEGPYSVAVYY